MPLLPTIISNMCDTQEKWVHVVDILISLDMSWSNAQIDK